MESIKFDGVNTTIGKGQEQYTPLHAFVDYADAGDDSEGNPISVPVDATVCFELTEEEIQEIVKTKRIWYRQLMHGRLFQPMTISAKPLYNKDRAENEQG